ncbi:glycine cleavage system protein GcvH [Paraburkholderia sp. BL10I2N1]|uniref:glycine cleavage system protein GcvH n=1 Tax=Paraburkholderia sp. BL10I2N1 TaxID=1938796 RepID=UPI00105B702A|nr:glycine cleavage system protein GcvH [Paraburkholderia sp. BL10I2N1]TDN58697.1 glycine cleavage system H protein [Paraburkholderia sp. BL10I2N1]
MSNLRFTEDHEWLRLDDDGRATVGITTFAQEQLGDLVFVDLPAPGKSLKGGEEAAVIESVKAAGEIKMPVAGVIVEINEALRDEPSKANEDPQGSGWFFRIELADPAAFDLLMDESAYVAFTGA